VRTDRQTDRQTEDRQTDRQKTDRQTDRHDEANSRFSQCCARAYKALKHSYLQRNSNTRPSISLNKDVQYITCTCVIVLSCSNHINVTSKSDSVINAC